MEKHFRKKVTIILLKEEETRVLVCNSGDRKDEWWIDIETFKATYEEV